MGDCSIVWPDLYKRPAAPLHIFQLHESQLDHDVIDKFLASATSTVIGVAASYGGKRVLKTVALATKTHSLRLSFTSSSNKTSARHQDKRKLLEDRIWCNTSYKKLALDAEKVAAALFFDLDIRVCGLVDAQSLSPDLSKRHTNQLLLNLLGGVNVVDRKAVLEAFDTLRRDVDERNVVIRAWATYGISNVGKYAATFDSATPIDTKVLRREDLIAVAKSVRDADRLDALKPTKVKNDVNAKFSTKSGNLEFELTRYKSRMRVGSKQLLVVETSTKGCKPGHALGKVVGVRGKQASVKLSMNRTDAAMATIRKVHTIGREDPTNAELARVEVVLGIMQGTTRFFAGRLVRKVFLGENSSIQDGQNETSPSIITSHLLNDSQRQAVLDLLSRDRRRAISIIQGPPGTGKTTVIAALVTSEAAAACQGERRGIWLAAQSNVAVKNIAKKLVDVGFYDFKILVSHEFHFDWHEHLYQGILQRNLIRSDQFQDDINDTAQLLNGCQVLLCTLSMFSHPRLMLSGFTRLVPVETVVVDEASQIEVGDYMPLLHRFGAKIKKLAFVGDDKQLAPFGQDDFGTLRSIFEMANVRKEAIFLDTQYRMPTMIGNFISKHVYGGKLKSSHPIVDRACCRFVDVARGKEQRAGNSYQNTAEAECVIRIAKRYHKDGKAYCIITPYDAQRGLLEELLKRAEIPWEGRCFNVDSFQGNEDDHIIISVVRSDKIGFLRNLRRSNVMLSRCKKSMIICTSRVYLAGEASSTLLGKLCREWGSSAWISWNEIVNSW